MVTTVDWMVKTICDGGICMATWRWKCCAQIRRFILSCHTARPPPKRRDKKQMKLSQLSNSVNGMTHEPT
jgi:hypothetical protein